MSEGPRRDGEIAEPLLRIRGLLLEDLRRCADQFGGRARVEPLLKGDAFGFRHGSANHVATSIASPESIKHRSGLLSANHTRILADKRSTFERSVKATPEADLQGHAGAGRRSRRGAPVSLRNGHTPFGVALGGNR
jgi:hypothetical protein